MARAVSVVVPSHMLAQRVTSRQRVRRLHNRRCHVVLFSRPQVRRQAGPRAALLGRRQPPRDDAAARRALRRPRRLQADDGARRLVRLVQAGVPRHGRAPLHGRPVRDDPERGSCTEGRSEVCVWHTSGRRRSDLVQPQREERRPHTGRRGTDGSDRSIWSSLHHSSHGRPRGTSSWCVSRTRATSRAARATARGRSCARGRARSIAGSPSRFAVDVAIRSSASRRAH